MKKEGGKEWQIEVTTFRADAYEPGSRKPVVAFGERIEEDLVRRDFTVNAMAVDIVAGEFVDRGVGCVTSPTACCAPRPCGGGPSVTIRCA